MEETQKLGKLVGEKISDTCKTQNLTQDSLSKKAGIHVNYLSMIEKAKREASIDIYRCIADALNIPTWQLFCDISKEIISVLQIFEDCFEKEIQILGCLLQGLKASIRQNDMLNWVTKAEKISH